MSGRRVSRRKQNHPRRAPPRSPMPRFLRRREDQSFRRRHLIFILVREVCLEISRGKPYCWQSTAIMALQEAGEAFLVRHLGNSAILCPLVQNI